MFRKDYQDLQNIYIYLHCWKALQRTRTIQRTPYPARLVEFLILNFVRAEGMEFLLIEAAFHKHVPVRVSHRETHC